MKINYHKTVFDKILEAKQEADVNGKEIESIELTQAEMISLKKHLRHTLVFTEYRDKARQRDEISITLFGIKVFTSNPMRSLQGWGTNPFKGEF